MPSAPQRSPSPAKLISATTIARIHTRLAFTAFSSALVLGCALHYKKIVKNGVAGYPQEWFPSVSATIGDWYPERNLFQVLIALTSGFRFGLTYLQYRLHSNQHPTSRLPGFLGIVGVIRTFACGGWVYVPSYEAHGFHDVAMISYIVCNIPWMWGGISCSTSITGRRLRKWVASAFFGSLVPLVYFFIQHAVHRIPGAYTHYAFFEWGLIFLDVFYDSATELEFRDADLQIAVGESLSHGIRPESVAEQPSVDTLETPSPTELSKPLESTSAYSTGINHIRPNIKYPVIGRFLADAYLSYIFWTLYTSLAPSFFYYSVWALAVSGTEAALFSTLSPVILVIRPLRRAFASRRGRTLLWLGSLGGLASYASPSPAVRVTCVALGNACLSLGKAIDWAREGQAGYEGILLTVGLLLHSLSKHLNHSNNPLWPIVDWRSGGHNKTGLMLGLLAILEFYYRPDSTRSVASNPPITLRARRTEPWLTPAVSLAGLIFSLHQLLSDGSSLIVRSWTGYPITGPVPAQHEAITLIVQASGIALALCAFATSSETESNPAATGFIYSILTSPVWALLGGLGAYIMHTYTDWQSYMGGLILGLVLTSIAPIVVQRAGRAAQARGIARVFGVTWFIVPLFDFLDTLTVAYAFVPGGQYLRERTDLVLALQLLLLIPTFNWSFTKVPALKLQLPSIQTSSHLRGLLVLTSVTALAYSVLHTPVNAPAPHKPWSRIVQAGIWTVHFGIDEEGRDSQRRMRDLVKDMQLDILGLLETDLQRIPYGNRDLTRIMAEDLGYYVDLGPGPNKHTWGAVLLSKFPILKSTHHLLPSPHGELAPAIEAVLDMYGTEVTVIVSHNGQEEDPLDRTLQSTELARIMAGSYPRPVIFLGYVVTKPLAKRPDPYEILVADGRVHDIDQTDWDRWCEYILYRGLYRTAYARVSRSTITDTELQIGQFVVPQRSHPVTNDTEPARYLRSWKESLPQDHWFPMEYWNPGQRGHFYHVFDPLYYNLPEGVVV